MQPEREIVITERQKRKLEKLVQCGEMYDYGEAGKCRYDSNRFEKILREARLSANEFNSIDENAFQAMRLQRAEADKLEEKLHRTLCEIEASKDYVEALHLLKDINGQMNSFEENSYKEPSLEAYRDFLRNAKRRCKPEDKEYIRALIMSTFYFPIDLLHTFLNMKIERVEALEEIDQSTAFSYLRLYPFVEEDLKEKRLRYPEGPEFAYRLYAFPKWDIKTYGEIIKVFKVKPETPETRQEESLEILEEKGPEQLLHEAVGYDHRGIFSQDTKVRICYFIEDSLELIPPQKLTALNNSFSRFRLLKKMKDRENRPSDLKIRNFFDDVTLDYIRDGEIPSVRDLEMTYRRVLRERN